jgi:enamine deaminase RidA (YjgF/YER057c/UK114 family)
MTLASSSRTRLMPSGHWDWLLPTPFSHGWKVGNLVFVGGQVPIGPDGKVVAPDIATQTREVLTNVDRVLAQAGASMRDLVKLNTYYRFDGSGPEEDEFWKALTRVRIECLADPGPAATAVRVVGFGRHDTLIEVEAIAAVPDEEGHDVERVRIMPEGHWDWTIPTPFSQGWKVGNIVFVGGQVSADGAGKIVGVGDIATQTRNTFENIRAVLREVGGDLDDIVKLNTYYKFDGTGPEEDEFWKEMTKVRLEYLPDPGPAATAVRVVGFAFEHTLIEIEAIAVLGGNTGASR